MSLLSTNQFRINHFDFSLNLTRELATSQNANLLLSPASITLVLAMCYFGASGETKQEMKQKVFGLEINEDDIKRWSQAVLQLGLQSNDEFKLKFANRIYANQNYDLKDKYVKFIAAFYHAAALRVNFDQESARITEEINNWVAEITEHHITDLVAPGVLSPNSIMVLINALFFRGAWMDKFQPAQTKMQSFHTSANEIVQVEVMRMIQRRGYFEDMDVQVLELSYRRSPVSMIFVLPKERNGLKTVLENLDGQQFAYWLVGLTPTRVSIEIPKFKIETSFGLNDVLKKLGIVKAFTNGAEFSEMTSNGSLQISQVVHKSFIKIDENGTEATSAVHIQMRGLGRDMPDAEPKKFTADRPFLFFMIGGNNFPDKNILFIGQFYGKNSTS